MRQPNYVSHYLRLLKPQIQKIPIDKHTQVLLTNLVRKRLQRDQIPQFSKLRNIITESSTHENTNPSTYHIPEILNLCYKQPGGLYADDRDIQWFLRTNLKAWPHESQKVFLENEKDSLDFKSKNIRTLPHIKFPNIDEDRVIPSLLDSFPELTQTDECQIEPLTNISLDSNLNIEYPQKVLTKILKLIHALRSNSILTHPRKIMSPIAMIPLSPLGEPVPLIRHKNIIRDKIRYIREVLYSMPPLNKSDFIHLESTLDRMHGKKVKTELDLQVMAHYEQFLKKSYYLDVEKTTCEVSKYAFIRTEGTVDDERYFTTMKKNVLELDKAGSKKKKKK
ncbi:hypothetical protein WICPIJ_010160 [Wickerhamomyces pijperi]|uniref:Genetic interactor of prohibitin 5, mitochondrial n=1 Tax=Wickerhamomyces pijperi TaxID=599730 RepID=A0A9P8PHJ7_WICPI|nr:hypothetical protein WICPIJ_010160 [Wickerhamomyces pijperi]